MINAINAQNAQVSAGQLGGTPSVPGQQMNLAISVQERLQTPEQFGNVILRTNPDGSLIRVKDVARVELGSESYSTLSRYNGKPATGIAVKLATGANALETASNIDDYLKGAEAFFPQGLKAVYPFDTTPVVKISIHEVVRPSAKPCFWCFWSCTCSSRTSAQPSFRPSRCPSCFSARSACCRRSVIPSTR